MIQLAQRAYSLGEYFCIEEMSDIKHEYYVGSIYAMAGASINHNRIERNILTFSILLYVVQRVNRSVVIYVLAHHRDFTPTPTTA